MGMPSLNRVLCKKLHAGRVPEAPGMTNLFRKSSELPGVSKGCVNSPEILQGKEQEFLVFSCSRLSEAVGLGISWRSLLVPNLASVLCNINNQTVEETPR